MTFFPEGQVPVVPDLVMPEPAQTIATLSIGVVALIALGVAIRYGVRHHTALYVVVLLGGVIASFNEPVADLLGGCLHPQTGAWVVFTTFDRPIPAWAVIAYGLFFGAVPLLVFALMRAAANPRRRMLQCVAVIFTANLLIELPILSPGIYVYYGDQPFKMFGLFPLHWLFINGVGVATIAVALYRFGDRFTGPSLLWWLAIPAAAQVAALTVSTPAFSLYNTEAGTGWKSLASVATMLLGAATLHALSKLVPQSAPGDDTAGRARAVAGSVSA
jgi:hypothetical protein